MSIKSLIRNDETLIREKIKQYMFLIQEYELIKAGNHPRYRFVTDFYKEHNLTRQNFIKYYNRFKNDSQQNSLLPRKRGPRYKVRKTKFFIEEKVIMLRQTGANRYEIYSILKEKYKQFTPSLSTIYGILRKNNLNKLKPTMKRARRMIIKEKAGELGHIDCHYLPKGIIQDDSKRYYLVAIMDSCTRIVWVELVEDIKSLTVMFATLRMINLIKLRYNIQFAELLTDNGAEFGRGPNAKNKDSNPFERMLKELGVKHRYTKPYRPQTNGKIERFWRTIKDDLLEEMVFDSVEHFRDELEQYVLYFNEIRENQALNGKTPEQINKSCHRIT